MLAFGKHSRLVNTWCGCIFLYETIFRFGGDVLERE